MAVFTSVSELDARELLEQYTIREFVSLRGSTAGIENTNYFLSTTQGEYVLTLFEVLTLEQLPFYIELMHHLAAKGVPVPEPMTRRDGKRICVMHGKPCSIVTRLRGGYEPEPTVEHCRQIARTQAQAHLAAQDFPLEQPNLRGLSWWQATVPHVLPFLDASQSELIQTVLQEQSSFADSDTYRSLPQGPAHCDLFRDNVLFAGTSEAPQMGGIIDFYFAGCDTWLFDVAVAVNDWCIDRLSGALNLEKAQAWLESYAQVRPFTEAEHSAWPILIQAAALRFWISRLYDFYLPRPAQTLKPHDPRHFERVLRQRRDHAVPALPR